MAGLPAVDGQEGKVGLGVLEGQLLENGPEVERGARPGRVEEHDGGLGAVEPVRQALDRAVEDVVKVPAGRLAEQRARVRRLAGQFRRRRRRRFIVAVEPGKVGPVQKGEGEQEIRGACLLMLIIIR